MDTTRSPIKAKPLRMPGESVHEELQDVAFDLIAPYLLGSVVVVFLAALEWVLTLRHSPRDPWAYTAIALVVVGISVWKLWGVRGRIAQLKLGRDGERVVGQFLEGLRVDGARVFHDIPADGFNLDHVVLSPHGFYVVETKTRMKPASGEGRVTFAGSELRVAGYRPDRDPIVQAQGGARWLRSLLEASTGKRFTIRGVVVFPGWQIERMSEAWKRNPELPWVLEPKALPSFIEHDAGRIEMSEVALAAFHLSRYIRVAQRKPG